MSWKNAEAASEFMKRLANPNRRLSGLWTAPRRIEDNVRSWQIVLKNSKIARLRKSRKCSALAISAAARHCRIDTTASDGFWGNLCGPSRRSERNAPAVLRIFSHERKRTFSTKSALSGPEAMSGLSRRRDQRAGWPRRFAEWAFMEPWKEGSSTELPGRCRQCSFGNNAYARIGRAGLGLAGPGKSPWISSRQ
jgi:hypothetical protein